jgi:hypothetical protein
MLNERAAELIHAEVDGILAQSDRAELQAILDQSEEAREFRHEMLGLAKIFGEVPDHEPPAGLNRRILDSIELPTPRRLPSWLRNWFRPASYSLAVATGMLMTVGMVKLLPVSDTEMTTLVGTMMKQGEVLPEAALGQLGINLEAVEGSIQLKDLNGTLALQFSLKSADTVEIGVNLADSGLVFGGFADDRQEVAGFEVSGGDLRVFNEGSQQFVVFLRRSPAAGAGAKDLGVTISQDNLRVFEGSIAFGG